MLRRALLATAVALAVGGCGGGEDDAGRPASGAAEPQEPSTTIAAAAPDGVSKLVDVVVRTHRAGELWRLCDLLSARGLEKAGGDPDRCRREWRRAAAADCQGCSYRSVTVRQMAETASGAGAVVWLLAVEGNPRFEGESGLELRFVREQSRWVLEDLLEEGSEA